MVISGANHSQFGFYGWYPFDGTPTISHASQIAQTVDILLATLGVYFGSSLGCQWIDLWIAIVVSAEHTAIAV